MWTHATSPSIRNTATLNSTVSLLFESPSTRTKFGFEVAAQEMGARTISLDSKGSRLASGESLEDSLQTLTQMSDQIVVVRTRASLSELQLEGMRVISAGDAEEHPTQALVDLFTIASLQVVNSWSPPSGDKTAFGYVLESFSNEGNIQPSPWVAKRLQEMTSMPNLHPLPRLEATRVVIKDSNQANPVSTQLRLQVPVKMSALLWMDSTTPPLNSDGQSPGSVAKTQ